MAFVDESRIQGYLQEQLTTLEQRLAFPKNTWKRREEIQSKILDAQQRLGIVQRSNRRDGRRPILDHRYSSDRPYQGHSSRPIRRAG